MDETPLKTTEPPAPRQPPFNARAGAPAIAEVAFTIDLSSNHRGVCTSFLEAMHESRRCQAAGEIGRYRHLIQEAQDFQVTCALKHRPTDALRQADGGQSASRASSRPSCSSSMSHLRTWAQALLQFTFQGRRSRQTQRQLAGPSS
jgi:hypothetical protein